MQQVNVPAEPIEVLAPTLGEQRFADFAELAAQAAADLAGRAVINVNSTATGGGVAEMLQALLPYARGVGIDIRWLAIDGTEAFFDITKRVHNHIYGVAGDGGELGPAERQAYEDVLAGQVDEILATASPGDAVLLHDPQTLGLAPQLRRHGARVVWRSHIGADVTNDYTESGWQFLRPYLDDVEVVVVSRAIFGPPGYPPERVVVIPPSIDPLAVKNVPLDPVEVHTLLAHAGLLQGSTTEAPVFRRRDGSPGRVDRQADVLQLGPPPPDDVPLVVQVSRWDRLKDMAGVLTAFARHVDGGGSQAHLVLAGPNVHGVADDPEGAAVYAECADAWRALPHAQRRRVHLACLPSADVDENAVLVNALQRRADVVVQKSLAEGFGLTVVEAMWKGRAVVASAVGGIVDQLTDDTGVLLPDPTDLDACGEAIRDLVYDPGRIDKLGRAAQERARDFLTDVHLERWAALLTSLPAPR